MTDDSPEAIACHKCDAQPGQPCRTPTGNRASEAHLPRRRAYHRRHRDDPIPDSPILRAARAEAHAKDRLDRT